MFPLENTDFFACEQQGAVLKYEDLSVMPSEDPSAKAQQLMHKLKAIQQQRQRFPAIDLQLDYFALMRHSSFAFEEVKQKTMFTATSLFSENPTGVSIEREL